MGEVFSTYELSSSSTRGGNWQYLMEVILIPTLMVVKDTLLNRTKAKQHASNNHKLFACVYHSRKLNSYRLLQNRPRTIYSPAPHQLLTNSSPALHQLRTRSTPAPHQLRTSSAPAPAPQQLLTKVPKPALLQILIRFTISALKKAILISFSTLHTET